MGPKEYQTLEVKLVEGDRPIDQNLPGVLWKWGKYEDSPWLFGCPRCGVVMHLQHKIEIKEGKPTISPSVGCSNCKAHFFVKEGKVEVLSDWQGW